MQTVISIKIPGEISHRRQIITPLITLHFLLDSRCTLKPFQQDPIHDDKTIKSAPTIGSY